jgi:shikimate kinase
MSRRKVESLALKAKNKTIFLCGLASNAGEMLDLFGKVIFLEVDKATLRNRLMNRTNNDFGKTSDEIDVILGWHVSIEQEYRSYGAIIIDATRPLSVVVDDIEKQSSIYTQ